MSVEVTTATSVAGYKKPPLDDLMLAMDVVDTLRRRERLLKKELNETGREEDLKDRLRRIYAQQGIEVPDHVIEQGVKALKEDRFTYKPPSKTLATRLAHIYVSRSKWGKWVGAITVVGLLGFVINYFAFVAPDARLSDELKEQYAVVMALAQSDYARKTAEQFLNAGNVALQHEDTDAAKAVMVNLEDLRTTLEQEYTIQIVNRPGMRSGVWRVPDVNSSARNHYIIVEAVDPAEQQLTVPIKSEESGKIERVKIWGLRVDAATFKSVGKDKNDNGIIERNRFGYKRRGYIKPSYEMQSSGGAITKW